MVSSSSVSPVYLLNCSVCQAEFSSEQNWLDHLAQDDHQKLARKETNQFLNTDLNTNLKECSLVIFTSYDLNLENVQNILKYFGSRSSQDTLVTDFVWWEDRPRFGIIQFESRKKVDEISTWIQNISFPSDGLFIDGQKIQVKKAVDLLHLELNAILPGSQRKSPDIFLEPPISSRKRSRESKSETSDLVPSSKKNCESTSPPPHPHPPPSDTLHFQYMSIRKLVVIPDHLLSQAAKAVSSLKTLFKFSGNDPCAEIAMFRTWHLNLFHDDKEDLLVYLYRNMSPPEFPSSYSWIPREKICQLLHNIERSPDPQEFTILDKDPDDYTWRLEYTGGGGGPTTIPIRLISHKFAMTEVQLCRLYKYMMTFDPRFEHVLSLLYFWTNTNRVQFGDTDSKRRRSISLPEPLTMQWLLMHFMCYRKYIPTVREIQSRPHPVLRERTKGIDIGFDEDPKFVEEWNVSHGSRDTVSENLVEDVLQLFLEFFQFCWVTLDGGNSCIFNTKDGEVLRTEDFLSCKPGANGDLAWTTEMTREEVELLRGLHNEGTGGGQGHNQYKLNLRGWNLYMVHPFIFTNNFSVSWDIGFVVKLMKSSEEKLGRFFNKRKCGGEKAAEKRFGNLENVLTVEKVVREKIWGKMGRKRKER